MSGEILLVCKAAQISACRDKRKAHKHAEVVKILYYGNEGFKNNNSDSILHCKDTVAATHDTRVLIYREADY